ncbi:unnamed protein product [Rhodiola kirilowii]
MSDQSSSYPIICASFNQDNSANDERRSGFAVGTKNGFRIFDSNTGRLCYERVIGAFNIVEMLFSSSLLAIVGAGEQPALSPRRLCMFNSITGNSIRELNFLTSILGVRMNKRRLVVILQEKTFIYDLNNVAILDTIDTVPNLKGLCAFSYSLDGCFLALPASTTKGSVLVYNVMEFQSHCEIEAHRSPLTAITLSSNGMYLATASEQGTIIRVHLLSDASKSYSFRRGTYPSTIYSLALAPSAQLPDILVATSISGSVHAFSLGFATNRRIRRSNSLLGSIVPNSVSDMLDPAHHHVLHNVFPAGVKSYAVVRKVEKVEDESTSNPGYVAHRATVYIITFSGIFQEYSLTIDSQNLSSWNLMREFNLLTAIPTNVSKS